MIYIYLNHWYYFITIYTTNTHWNHVKRQNDFPTLLEKWINCRFVLCHQQKPLSSCLLNVCIIKWAHYLNSLTQQQSYSTANAAQLSQFIIQICIKNLITLIHIVNIFMDLKKGSFLTVVPLRVRRMISRQMLGCHHVVYLFHYINSPLRLVNRTLHTRRPVIGQWKQP